MSEIDAAAIRKTVRAMAARELVGSRIIADLLFQIGIIPRPTSLQNKKMDILPLKLSRRGLQRGLRLSAVLQSSQAVPGWSE